MPKEMYVLDVNTCKKILCGITVESLPCMMEGELKDQWHIPLGEVYSSTKGKKKL
jgi:hypothetical protein